MFLCSPCKEMAEKVQAEIDRELAKARESSQNWLKAHILEGGLLRGGSGFDEAKEEAG